LLQDVKEVANSVKKSVTTLQQEFQTDVKPERLQSEIGEQNDKAFSEGSDKDLDSSLGVSFPGRFVYTLRPLKSYQGAE
jgi:hypothetical protein